MDKLIHVEVTQQDIDLSIRCDSHLCAVALAMRRATQAKPNLFAVMVDGLRIYWEMPSGERYVSFLSEKITEWICNYDDPISKGVKPISFDLEPRRYEV